MTQSHSGYREFRRGWPIVLASMLGVGLGLSPMPFYTIGVFAPHLHQEFGWGMGEIFFGITITTFVMLVAGPLAGFLSSRYGPRPVALLSLFLFSLAFMSFALSNGSLQLYYLAWGAMALVGAGTLPITWTHGVNSWFEQRKGLALGLALSGTGLFGITSKPLTAWMIESFGWRGAYIGLGLMPLLIALPVAYVLFRNTNGDPQSPVSAKRHIDGLTFKETLRSWRLWLMVIAFVPISFALGGPIPNMENILKANHFSMSEIMQLTPFIGLSALIGRLVGGWLLDRFWAPAVALVILISPAIACWLLTQGNMGFGIAVISICLIGFAVGVEYDLMAFLAAKYFGMRSYSQTYTLLYVCFSIGAGFGPALFGWSFDRHGGYSGILTISSFLLVVSAMCFLALGRYRNETTEEVESPANTAHLART